MRDVPDPGHEAGRDLAVEGTAGRVPVGGVADRRPAFDGQNDSREVGQGQGGCEHGGSVQAGGSASQTYYRTGEMSNRDRTAPEQGRLVGCEAAWTPRTWAGHACRG